MYNLNHHQTLERLPKRRRECLSHVNEWFGVFEDLNRGPYVRELAEMMDLSYAAARYHIGHLIVQGLLDRASNRRDGVWLTKVGKAMFE